MKTFFLTLFLSLASHTVFAQTEGGTGLLYGEGHSYSLTAPKGWMLDNKSGVSQALHAVFYPAGSSWSDGTTVMYTNFAHYMPGQTTVDELINYDTTGYKKQSPDLKIVREKDIVISDSATAKVFKFYGDENGNHESVAYIPAPTGTVLVVITSRNKDEYEKYYQKFVELTQSYKWFASDVKP